ncbi:Alpha/Beta hydrolase protein [Aspergillus pseudoustus]|uniref:Alpha/Beta hydrolase protein n=1 Tax=Aspergillus pseudoustus TaxID=1810923 RepID=A0ABR4JQ75_9EURO
MSCPECFSGHINPSTPTGHVATLHGLDVYVAGPPENTTERKGIVVIIPDAFGWEFVNNRILADHYAQRGGFLVLLPDFMKGTAAPLYMLDSLHAVMKTGTLWDWVVKPYYIFSMLSGFVPFILRHRPGKSYPIVESFFSALRQSEGPSTPIGAAGFCWGGKHTVLLAHGASTTIDSGSGSRSTPLINAGFTGHPSFLQVPGDIEKLVIPVSFALGDLDNVLKAESIPAVRRVVEAKEDEVGGGEVKVYPGAGHGFCVRADATNDEASARRAAEAEEQAISFFQRIFAKVK